ncbi:MAG: class A beta-lactamase [Sneathiella sp.]
MLILARRDFFVMGSAALLTGFASSGSGALRKIATIEAELGGRIGASLYDTATGRIAGYRLDERFAMCSTFKVALAGAILQKTDEGRLSQTALLDIDTSNILSHSPITSQNKRMSIKDLCRSAVQHSDNTAANMLLEKIGGPKGMTDFFRSLGDQTTRLDRFELALNSNLPDDPRDTTTARAMAQSLATLMLNETILRPTSRSLLATWMIDEQNGKNRIRSAIPSGWKVGNKPGTSNNGAVNDIAVLWRPGKSPLFMSVYTNAPGVKVSESIKAITAVTSVLVSQNG